MFIFHMEISNECKIWARRLAVYLAIYIAVILISRIVFLKFNLLHTDVDSARYMLSALIQSEAAIIAIVVTMSLVVVQLAASSYSVRVIDIFRKTPDLWILQLVYGITIFWGLGVLKLIETAPSCALDLICQSNIENSIAFTYSIGIFVFVAIAPYMWHTMGLLRPSKIMANLAVDITKENILESFKRETADVANPNDAILPIIDIVRSALVKYDYETTRDGLRAIMVSTNRMFETETFEDEEEKQISWHLFSHLTGIGRLTLSMDDEYSTEELITNLGKIGETSTKAKLEFVTNETIIALCGIGTKAAERKLEWPTIMVIKTIKKIVKLAENEFEIQKMDFGLWGAFIKEIGMVAISNKLEIPAHNVAFLLGIIGKNAAENKQNRTISEATTALKNMGASAADKGLLELNKEISNSLHSVCMSIPSELEHEKSEAIRALNEVNAFGSTPTS